MRLYRKFALAAAMLAVVGTVSAATISFNFETQSGSAGSTGNSRTFTSDGVTVMVTSYGLMQGSSTALFQTAATGQWDKGLGVNNGHEDSYPANQHAVDNADCYTDFVMFQFSTAVDPAQLKIYQFGGDSDLDYWTGNVPASLAGLNLSALSGLTPGTSNASAPNGYRYADLTSPGTVNALLVAADLSGCNDFFKISGLSVEYTLPPPPPEGIPEPSTYATMGGALLGLGLFATRRKRQGN